MKGSLSPSLHPNVKNEMLLNLIACHERLMIWRARVTKQKKMYTNKNRWLKQHAALLQGSNCLTLNSFRIIFDVKKAKIKLNFPEIEIRDFYIIEGSRVKWWKRKKKRKKRNRNKRL
jgi:hypothetical protein